MADALRSAGLPLAGLEPLRPGGGVWRAFGPTGVWVVRLAAGSDAGELAATLAWATTLAAAGLPVPRPWRAPGAAAPRLVAVGGRWALVTEWAFGTTVAEMGWDEASAEALGRLLASAHALAAELPPSLTEGARRYDAAWAEGAWRRLAIDRAVPDVAAQEAEVVQAGLAAARQVLADAWGRGLGGPVVLAHADVHGRNVLEVDRSDRGVTLALIDLDRVGLAPIGLDLAFALLEHGDATAWACLRGYRQVRSLDRGFEYSYAAFRLLAAVDNLAFLAGIDHEHGYVAAAWPGVVAASAALTAPRAQGPGAASA